MSKYLCPFCVSSWDCDGPHIKQEDLDSFYERFHYVKEDLALLAKEFVEEYSKEKGLNLSDLEQAIYTKLKNRSFT
jgi:hypothetical protein